MVEPMVLQMVELKLNRFSRHYLGNKIILQKDDGGIYEKQV